MVASEIGESVSPGLILLLIAAAVVVAGLALFVKLGMTDGVGRRSERRGADTSRLDDESRNFIL
jgi:hypothetical protein